METPDPVIQQDPQDAEKDKLAYVEDFLKELRQNWQNSNAALGKALTVSLLLAFSFELLSRAAIAEASLGPFKLKDLSLIRKALPVLLAYYSYDILVNLGRVFQFEALHDTLLRALHPKVFYKRLDLFLQPQGHTVLSHTLGYGHERDTSRLGKRLESLLGWGVIFGMLGFQFYAYYIQFTRFGLRDFITWVA